jgi:inner membrane protein
MASVFAHIAIPTIMYASTNSRTMNLRLFIVAALCAILPDIDVLAFKMGIPYASPWGHRGFTHSFIFSALMAAAITTLYKIIACRPIIIFLVSFISMASHAILDAMTNGGLGVAFFWPIDNQRIFFPFRPIQVSPLGIAAFFSERGWRVIVSETLWIFFPAIVIIITALYIRRIKT